MPEPALAKLMRATMMVLGPSSRIMSRNESSKPRMIELMPTIAVMPITTPRTVSPDRILLARIVPSAIPIVSAKSATRTMFVSSRIPTPACSASIGSSVAALIDG